MNQRPLSLHVQRNPWPVFISHFIQLSARDVGLLVHDAGLSNIDTNLRHADADKGNAENNFKPVQATRGLPVAAGWAALMLAGWVWFARHDHDFLALVFLIAAFAGTYGIIVWMSGI